MTTPTRRSQPQKKLVTLVDRFIDELERWRGVLGAEVDAEERRGRAERLNPLAVSPAIAARVRSGMRGCGENRVAEVTTELAKLLASPARVRRMRRLAGPPPGLRAALRLLREIEIEADLAREQTIAGIDRARRNGKRVGRPPALDARGVRRARRLRASGKSTWAIAELLGIGQTTVRRALAASA